MEYLGHTQSANYTFGPWRSNAFRTVPISTLPPVQRPQQSFSPGFESPRYQQQQLPSQPESKPVNGLYRSRTTVDGYWKQPPVIPAINGSSQGNGYCGAIPSPGSPIRSKTSVGDFHVRFDDSYRLPQKTNDEELSARSFQQPSATNAGERQRFLSGPPSSAGCVTARQPTALDWASWTKAELSAADRARSGSELVRADVLTLCRDACDRTRRTQTESTRRIGDRVDDVRFWRDEIRKETELSLKESSALQRAIGSLERTLGETSAPLRIAEECVQIRREKIGGELVHDEVERELLKEIDGIRQCQKEMADLLNQVKNLATLNQRSQSDLVRDDADKNEALRLDKTSYQLRQTSQGLQRINGIENFDNTISDPESWIQHTNELIAKSQGDRAISVDARNGIEQLMDKCATLMVNQWNTVNIALNDRVRDYIDARNKLQTQLSKVLEEKVQVEKSRELLLKCIRDKEAPMMLAQTRLATRVPRPNMESCKDIAQDRLTNELREIDSTVEQLRAKMADIEQSMRNLNQTRSSLEHDLNIKNNSIHVDRDICLSWRKSFNMSPRRTVSY